MTAREAAIARYAANRRTMNRAAAISDAAHAHRVPYMAVWGWTL